MSTFLNHMNTADIETLELLPGVSRALAERISAGRPFETIDDLLQVNGVGPKFLQRLQHAYEQNTEAPPDGAIALPPPAEELLTEPEAAAQPEPEPVAPRMEDEPELVAPRVESKPKPAGGFGKRLLRVLLILALILACLAAVGAAVYYGSPYLYQRFVQPVDENAVRIDQLATRQASDQDAVNAQLSELQTRIDLLAGRLDAAEQTINDHTAAIAQLEAMQTLLDQSLGSQRDSVMVELKYQVMMLRSMELLSRARLYLSQSNFGVARQDVAAARELIAQMSAVTPMENLSTLNAVLDRLDLALANLPAYPVIAANDLEIAWQLLLDGLPANLPPTPTLTLEPPTATPEATQTPIPLLTPEAQVTATSQG